MPSATTMYGNGGGTIHSILEREPMDLGATPDFYGDLDRMRRMFVRPAAPAPFQGQALRGGVGYGSGTGAISREDVRRGGGSDSGSPVGVGHSWVTNIVGGPRVMGGMVRTGYGAAPGRTFYGGWDPTNGSDFGPAHFAQAPLPSTRAFAQPIEIDPETRAGLQAMTLGKSRAESERAAYQDLMSREPDNYTPPRGQARSYAPSGGAGRGQVRRGGGA